jgi:ABC-2 type transport system permease protein
LNANVYFMELRRHWKEVLVWSAVLVGLNTLITFFYPIIIQSKVFEQLDSFFNNPFFKSMLTVFGVNLDNMTNVLGFFVTYYGLYTLLLGSIVAMLLGSRLIADEESRKTAEFLLTKPVTRAEVLNSKLAALGTMLTALNLIVVPASLITMAIMADGPYDAGIFLIVALQTWLLMLALGAMGVFISTLTTRGRFATKVGLGVVLGFYFINGFTQISETTRAYGYISPFRFVDINIAVGHFGCDWWRVAYFIGLTALCILVSHILYRRKDILL